MKLMERDKKLLESLGRYSILSTRQVREFFFKNIAKTNMHRRLRLLEKNSLIRGSQGLDDGQNVWALTREGGSQICCKVPSKNFNKNTFLHDVILNELRFALEKENLGKDWTSEWEMKCKAFDPRRRTQEEKRTIPDGIFTVIDKDKPLVVAVELEMTLKSKERYREILKSYDRNTGLFLVWYVVSDKAIGKTLFEEWRRIGTVGNNPYLAFSLLEEVLADFWNAIAYFPGKNYTLPSVLRVSKPIKTEITKEPDHSTDHSEIKGSEKNGAAIEVKIPQDSKVISNSKVNEELPSVANPSPSTKKEKRGEGVSDYRQEEGVTELDKGAVGNKIIAA